MLADIPSAGSGLGSSSSVTVGLLHALWAYQGQHVSAKELAEWACTIEIERCGKKIGRQDQYIAAFGGIRDIRFGPGDRVIAEEVGISMAERRALQEQIMLFYTGITRSATLSLPSRMRTSKLPGPSSISFATSRALPQGDCGVATWTRLVPRCARAGRRSGSWRPECRTADRPGGRRGARGGGVWRQADRRWWRRLPARHLPHRAAARRAREPGGHDGVSGKAGSPRVPGGTQHAARHLELISPIKMADLIN